MTTPACTIESRWTTSAELLSRLIDDGSRAPVRLFQPMADAPPDDLAVGALVSVNVRLEDRDTEFHLHARVLDRRSGSDKRGVTLEFLPEERERVDLLVLSARGESVPYRRRRYQRTPVSWACSLACEHGQLHGTLTNVNERGCHVSVEPPPGPDERVQLEISLPDGRTWDLAGRVADSILEGPQRGIGVEFLFSSAEEREAVAADVAALRAGTLTD